MENGGRTSSGQWARLDTSHSDRIEIPVNNFANKLCISRRVPKLLIAHCVSVWLLGEMQIGADF
jgi:hypothetical protein